MELVQRRIQLQSESPKEPFLLLPIGDIQWAGQKGDTVLGMLQRHIEWGVEHKAWFLGMGDYIDFASPSNRQRLRSAALYDTATDVIDDKALDLTFELFEKALKPSKGRWLGLLEGHHFSQLKDGTTTDMRLCEMLGAQFLGTSAIINLVFQGPHNKRGTVKVWCHHGVGGGGRPGSPLLKLDQLPLHWDADIYLMGHQTKKVAVPVDYITSVFGQGRSTPHLVHKTKLLACTGGFLKGYQVGRKDGIVPRGNYVEQKMLNPVALGGVLIKIRPRWAKQGNNSTIWLPDMSVEQ